jgi:TetR/AcrR family transcriptional regulator, transcriptional repressor for nem operon
MDKAAHKPSAKEKILGAALQVIRTKGYSATTVDDLCETAGVTKGAFFHHFKSKEDLAVSAANYWSEVTNELFAHAPYHLHKDPLDRLLGYVEFRRALLKGETPEFTCLVGTMVQEIFHTNPLIREACQKSIFGHSANVARDIKEAKKLYAPDADFNSESLALHIQAVIQGAFILAKAKEDSAIAAESLAHLRRYLELIFHKEKP